MEKTCHHMVGKDIVFGTELSLARSGLPLVVEKCAIFLMAYTNTKDLFFEEGNRAMVEYFRLQFDQGKLHSTSNIFKVEIIIEEK